MKRQFEEHLIRRGIDLNGPWDFCTDPEDRGLSEGWEKGLPQKESVIVPSVWNTQMGLLEYEGAAWYEKKFYTDGGTLRFVFEAVLTQAQVWLDGNKLGEHYGGFCQFEFIVAAVEAGMHTLTVCADNRFDSQSIPMARTDWWHYGGISRSVSVEKLSGLCALYNHFDYSLSEDLQQAKCSFTAEIYNAEDQERCAPISFLLNGEALFTDTETLAPHTAKIIKTPEFTVEAPRLWEPGNGALYEIAVLTDTDDLLDRIGFRKIEVEGARILLNGKPFEIRGVNRHEENTDFGFAFPPALMKRDLDIIKNMHANAVRGAHYPNSRIFLDMLDEYGLAFWSEIPLWGNGFTPEACGDPLVLERAKAMHREMVRYYYNHPSILIWGMHNEMPTASMEVRQMTEWMYGFLKEQGGNRLVTYASDKIDTDICFDLCDLYCINRYDGWYYGDRDSWEAGSLSLLRKRIEELKLGIKPIIISEFGAAAIYGHHTFDDLKWSEEYQAELLRRALLTFKADPLVAGFYIWQFCDIRTAPQNGLNRARHYNNKGLLNEYRRPKQAYFAVKALYEAFEKEEADV